MPHKPISRKTPVQCPHCKVSCLGGTGLSAHIRGKHSAEQQSASPNLPEVPQVLSSQGVSDMINACSRQVEAWTALHNSLTESLEAFRDALKEA